MIEIERMKKEVLSSSHSMKEQKNYKTNLSVKQGKKKVHSSCAEHAWKQKMVIWTQPCDVWWCYLENADAQVLYQM